MSARNRQHNYPSLLTRVLRARERGIRDTLANANPRNPHKLHGSGLPVWSAYDIGRVLALFDGDVAVYFYDPFTDGSSFPVVNLAAECESIVREFEATVPCGWPRDRQTRAAA